MEKKMEFQGHNMASKKQKCMNTGACGTDCSKYIRSDIINHFGVGTLLKPNNKGHT